GLGAGDVMVDGSVRWERLRPLVLSWVAVWGREPRAVRELAGRVETIGGWSGCVGVIGLVGIVQAVTGASASGPSWRRVWKERRGSLRAIGSEARGGESPRGVGARCAAWAGRVGREAGWAASGRGQGAFG